MLTLVPELIPGPLWGRSGSRMLPSARWRRIRAVELERAGSACEVCGRAVTKGLVAHERWSYSTDDAPTALLWSIRMQCRQCDAATHIGLADSQGRGRGARATLARVNGISMADVELLIEGAFERWAQLSSCDSWRVDVHPPLLATHPDLRIVAGQVPDRESSQA